MEHEENLSRLMLRVLMDEKFRHFLLEAPEEAAASMDVVLKPSQVEHIKGLDPEQLEEFVFLTKRTMYTAAGTLW